MKRFFKGLFYVLGTIVAIPVGLWIAPVWVVILINKHVFDDDMPIWLYYCSSVGLELAWVIGIFALVAYMAH